MEILRGVERRRRWSWADKLLIVAEVEAPGAVFAAVARRHDISRGQLWNWRCQVRSGEVGGARLPMPEFLPVYLTPEPVFIAPAGSSSAKPASQSRKPEPSKLNRLVITLPSGAQVRVEGMVDAVLLTTAIVALRG